MKPKRKPNRVYQDQTGIWSVSKSYGKKAEYYTEEDYIRAEYYIYNNLPYNEGPQEVIPKLPEGFLLEGEECRAIPGLESMYAITNKYRVININKASTLKPYMSNRYHYFIVYRHQVNMKIEYMNNGWEYNWDEVIPLYQEQGWPYIDYTIKHAPKPRKKKVTESV